MSKKDVLILCMMALAIFSRFLFLRDGVSIMPNFTAIGAIALLGAAHLKGYNKWILPLAALWVSDIVLNNVVYAEYYDHFQLWGNLCVYASIILIGIVGYFIMRQASWSRLAVASIVGSVIFFLVTNFGVWASGTLYPKSIAGLMESYTAGIPFFRNTLLGNLSYSFLLFGVYEFLAQRSDLLEPFLTKGNTAKTPVA